MTSLFDNLYVAKPADEFDLVRPVHPAQLTVYGLLKHRVFQEVRLFFQCLSSCVFSRDFGVVSRPECRLQRTHQRRMQNSEFWSYVNLCAGKGTRQQVPVRGMRTRAGSVL